MKDFADLFATKAFLPRGMWIGWTPELVWTYAIADALIGLAYYSITLATVYFLAKRRDFAYRRALVLVAALFFAGGTAQVLDLATLWWPAYWLDAGVKAATCAAAALAAVAAWLIVPKITALPSRRDLELAKSHLEHQVAVYRKMEQGLRTSEQRFRELSERLEQRIADRASELEAGNLLLQWEIEERHRAESQLQQANALLKTALAAAGRQANTLAQLNEMTGLMQGCRSESEVYAVVARFAAELFGAPSGAVYTLNHSRNIAEAAAVWGEIPGKEQVFAASDCAALRRRKFHPENAAQASAGCPHLQSESARRHICAPLTASGELLGVLHLRGRPVPVESHERALIGMAAERISLAVASLKLRESLTRQSVRDALTGLYNRRYLEEFLALEERRGLRTGRSIGIVMIDLDRFKQINDTHGHDAGDEVLRRVAEVLQEQTRAGDIPCRYGGEEFLLVLPGASLEVTMHRAEQLRALLEGQQIEFRGVSLGPITGSIGVAAFPESGTSITAALAAADRALYLAKQKGRNRVECEECRAAA